ncbi:hypothetical protein YTPLAS18_00820 [Nitrospira sp.]|nr:hypothetical protein YTPLAS18_00820 [Nitrospira sp.]
MLLERSKETKVSRQTLYEQVWATPMSKLAKQYEVSDVALAKQCRKHDIPYPGMGYWRRKETGKPVKQVPLPPTLDPNKQMITIRGAILPVALRQMSEDLVRWINEEREERQKLDVPHRLTNPHPLLMGLLADLERAKDDSSGAARRKILGLLNIHVGPQLLPRAYCILDTLLKGLEARGYQFKVEQDHEHPFGVIMNGERVEFCLLQEDAPSDQNVRGRLCLHISYQRGDGLQINWRDGKTTRLETCLNDFVIGLLKVAEGQKAWRLELEAIRTQSRRRIEEGQRCEEELARQKALEQEAVNWAKAQQLRAYLSEVKNMLIQKHGKIEQGSPADQWLTWAHQHADRIDPLTAK